MVHCFLRFKFWGVFLFLFGNTCLISQSDKHFIQVSYDDLNRWKTEISDLETQAAFLTRTGRHAGSLSLRKKILNLANLSNNYTGQFWANYDLAIHFIHFEAYDSAWTYFEKAKESANREELKEANGYLLWMEGMLEFKLNINPSTGILKCEEAVEIARNFNNQHLEAKCKSCFGNMTRMFRNYEKIPLPYHREALKLFQSLKDTTSVLFELIILGYNYRDAQRYEESFEVLNEALKILEVYREDKAKLKIFIGLGVNHADLGNGLKAREFWEKSLPECVTLGLNRTAQNVCLQLTSNYLGTKEYEKAILMTDSAIAVCPGYLIDEGASYYAAIYKAKGDFEKSLIFMERSYEERDSHFIHLNGKKLTEWQAKFQDSEKEKKIALQEQELKAEKEQQRLLTAVLLLAILSLAFLYWGYKNQQKAKKQFEEKNKLIEQQAAELLELDKTKSRFFANVSHELRTPLTLMLGPISSVIKHNQLKINDLKLLQIAKQNGNSLLKLVNEILDLSKLESRKLELKEESVSFYPFISRIVAAFESHAERSQIDLNLKYEADQNLTLQLDPNKFEKVVNNLLSNALKFTPPNRSVTLFAKEKNDQFLISVKDTGRGIHSDDLPYVFDRFYQAKKPQKGKTEIASEGGTGIGLALSLELAKLMEGKISAESEWGE